jgi:hypothetical protein
VLGVVGGVADQEDEPVAHGLGFCEAGPDQRPADALAAQFGVDRQRAQEQDLLGTQQHRPVADGTHQPPGLAGHEAQAGDRRDAGPVAVGDLPPAILAEGQIQEMLDLGPVLGAFGK